jgi:hypothetical protein
MFGHKFVNLYNPIDDSGVVSIDVRKLSETEVAEEDDWARIHLAPHRAFRRVRAASKKTRV